MNESTAVTEAPSTESVEPVVEPTVEPEPQQETEAPPPESTAEPTESVERVVPAADGYKLPEGIPPEVGKFANEHGFTQDQLDAALTQFSTMAQAQELHGKQSLRAMGEAQLKEWGEQADYKLNLAKRALKANDPDGTLTQALNETGYGNHPAVLNFLVRLGESMKEGGFITSSVHTPPGKRSVAQAMYPHLPSKE